MRCSSCRKDTVHELIEREVMGSGTGASRVILAIVSLGLSEQTLWTTWECKRCGKIERRGDL